MWIDAMAIPSREPFSSGPARGKKSVRAASPRTKRRPRALAIEGLEARTMLAAYAAYDGPVDDPPPPPANTPIGSFGSNCATSFFLPPPDSPKTIVANAPIAPAAAPVAAGAPPVEIFVTVAADEDDGNRNLDDISLREAILMANASEADATIHVPAGTFTISRSGQNEDTGGQGDLDIANPGHTTRILGAGATTTRVRNGVNDRVFHVHGGSTVEIRGMSIEEGIETNGGGIYNAGDLTLAEAKLQFNFAHSLGGAIANGPSALLSISQTVISSNSALYGGGIANYANGSVTLDESIVEENLAATGGGILNHGGTLSIVGTSVDLNIAGESGGGLANLSITTPATVTLTASSIIGNQVASAALGSSLAQGGGICNAAEGSNAAATITMIGGAISDNHVTAGDIEAVTDSEAQGGGIFNRAAGGSASAVVTVNDVNLDTNQVSASATLTAEASGGAVYNRAENAEATATFNANNGGSFGNSASALVFGGEGEIQPMAIARGGAFFNRARMDSAIATVNATSTSIRNNSTAASAVDLAQVRGEGGAIYAEAGIPSAQAPTATAMLTFNDSIVRSNVATATGGNEADASGGGLAIVGDFGHTIVDVVATTIESNRASADNAIEPEVCGGGIFNRVGPTSSLSRLSFLESTMRDNRLELPAGAVLFPRGGGLFADGGSITLRDSTLNANKAGATGQGGGVYSARGLAVVNSTISGNEAAKGGGLFLQSGDATISNSTIAMNAVKAEGGGVKADTNAVVVLRNSVVAKNILSIEGGTPTPTDLAGAFSNTSRFNWIAVGTGSTGIADGVDGNRVGNSGAPLEPFIAPLANNGGATETHLLHPTSPLIDAGDPAFDPNSASPALVMDQRHESRVLDGNHDAVGRVDIGAVEVRSSLFADLDGDGRVGLVDLMVIQRNLNRAGPLSYAEGDLNGDNLTNLKDVVVLLENYGTLLSAPSPQAPAAIVTKAAVDSTQAHDRAPKTRASVRRASIAPAKQSTAKALAAPAIDRALDAASESPLVPRMRARRR